MRVNFSFLFLFIHFTVVFVGYSQIDEKGKNVIVSDTLLQKDTVHHPSKAAAIDERSPKNALSGSISPAQRGDIDTTIFYSARDSIHFSLKKNTMTLYGKAKIVYGKTELEADKIVIDNNTSLISAGGRTDSLGRRIGFPIFKDGKEVYETRDIVYNFKSKKAKISEVVTRQGDGFMHGEQVFKSENNELYTIGNTYTTCNLANPHFRIVSKKAKMIPKDKIVTGPFYMEINNVPTPLGFAFGAFPTDQSRSSGIIFPRYGEEGRRGFFLKGFGYYFDINEYIKLKVTGEIYSKGAYSARIGTVYRKRYAFNGSIDFNYTNNLQSYDVENTARKADYNIRWTHSTNTGRSSRFSASVNIASSTYTSNNLLQLSDNTTGSQINNFTRKLSSSLSYSKTFSGTPFSMGINVRHNQDLVTEKVDMTLPSITFNVKNLYPFKKISDNEFLENLSVRYSMSASQQITNKLGRITVDGVTQDHIVPFDAENFPLFFKNGRRSIQHTIPISSSIKLLKYFVVSPSFNYSENWYFERWNWALDETGSQAIALDTLQQFGRAYRYSLSVNLNTRIYGTYIFRNSRLKAIRHVVNPSISYSYTPDFSKSPFDFFQTIVTADNREIKKFIYNGSAPPQRESNSLSFSIGNSLEMKVRNRKDSVTKKISLLNSFSISSRYNFAADSFNLAPFSLSANTNVLNNKLNINVSATLDPYEYLTIVSGEGTTARTIERRTSRFAWEKGFSLGRITSARLALSTNLSPKGRKKDAKSRNKVLDSELLPEEKRFLLDHPGDYVDFDIPWNLRLSYNLSYTKSLGGDEKVVQTIRLNGDVSLTKKWKITFNSGYDFERGEITQTRVSINRDLHCWRMSLGWVPFGRFQSYNFTIGVKSGILRDLKLDRQRSFFDN